MLFMVIEHFKNADSKSVGARFKQYGRMLPEGVVYQASWVHPVNARCFQIMEALDAESLTPWIESWSDLVSFEVVAVVRSTDYWPTVEPEIR